MASSLKLATTTFQTKPNEELLAVDVYAAQTSEAVVNSYQNKADTASSSGGLFGGLNFSGLKSLLATAKKAMSFVAQGAKIYQGIKNGNLSSALGAAGKLAGMSGLSAIVPALRTAQRAAGSVQNFIKNPSLSGAMRMAGTALGPEGAALTQMGSIVASTQRQLTSFSRAMESGNILGMISSADRLTNGAGQMIGQLDRASQTDFGFAASKALGLNTTLLAGKPSLDSLLDMSGSLSNNSTVFRDGRSDTAVQAGVVAGTAWAASKAGISNVFSSAARFDTDENYAVARSAGIPLAQQAVTSGDFNLFKDILGSSSKLAKDIMGAIPGGAKTLVSTLSLDQYNKNSADGVYVEIDGVKHSNKDWYIEVDGEKKWVHYYDDTKKVLTEADKDWDAMTRDNERVLSSIQISQNSDFQSLLCAKTASQSHDFSSSSVPDEAYLLLGSTYRGESVRGSLQEDFPEYYSTISDDEYEGYFA